MAPAHGQSVLTFQPKSRPAQDFQDIVDIVAGERFAQKKDSSFISRIFG